MHDEFLDLVDKTDSVIGKKRRSEVYAEKLKNFRVVNAFLVNSQGELWVPRRSASKRIFPLGLDMGMGGHVESGESYETAFARETQEELNLNITDIPWKLLGKLSPFEHPVSAFMHVYEIQVNKAPLYNPDDFIESFWMKPSDLLDWINKGEPCKDDLPTLIRHFYI